ncbi:hypothetical protein [Candidatus Enterovibrio escicola]|uniref:hypothetical protein n=1 Tax=Candidatus Enterovibrio escicola TaxID=1927127 RepID=UPI001CC22B3E|nr:hypothetical protein [Candidatus Enterovibrio escacola]
MILKIKKMGQGHQHLKTDDIIKIIEKENSIRLNANVAKSFYRSVKDFANKQDKTVTQVVVNALIEHMKNHEKLSK